MKNAYRALAGLISLGVLVQAMTIALGWFTALKDMDDGLVIDKNTDFNTGQMLHSIVGLMVIPLLAILLLIVSFFAGVAGGVKWAAFVFGLVVLQVALAFAGWALPAIGALHGANALALIAVAGMASRRAAASPESAPATEAKL
ncbi:hypothetical protein EV643_10121 [Kribbella sp. VKM Ac-2527]|uniref:Uncharacterized protein n=1 Tax=Kribbella caucasensis TaxID=2512215 RepID=A0A4V3CB20_9ACTN|nr:hypothetical protein [Kribbella sp. VKM Ac-2527]TDO54240.1 hypothetical protein EV643_10121 [Kribbella sp. VKM Ac-2527]